MEKFLKWLKNSATSFCLLILLPLTSIAKGVCTIVDIFIDNQSLTDIIKYLNEFENLLSNYDGSKKDKTE